MNEIPSNPSDVKYGCAGEIAGWYLRLEGHALMTREGTCLENDEYRPALSTRPISAPPALLIGGHLRTVRPYLKQIMVMRCIRL